MSIIIRKPLKEEREEICALFAVVVREAFVQDEFAEEDESEIADEIQYQTAVIDRFLSGEFASDVFLVAYDGARIVGTIAYGPINNTVRENLVPLEESILEIKCVYVLPEFQGLGVGTKLFSGMIAELGSLGVAEYYLDCGFGLAQEFWLSKLGEPFVTLRDYYGAGAHHMIWKCKVN